MSSATVVRAPEDLKIDRAVPKANRAAGWFVLIGALLSALFGFWHHERFWSAYLVAFTYVLSITLGALFFVIIQHLVRAGWSVTVRRTAEGIAFNFRWLWILFLPLLVAIGLGYLQPEAKFAKSHAVPAATAGADHGEAAGDDAHSEWVTGPHLPNAVHGHMSHAKELYLSFWGVTLRFAIYFLIWIGLSWFYYSNSVKQDLTGDQALSHRMQRWAAPSVVLFGLTTALCGMDLLMALDPYWFSTVFGLYFFAGCFLSFCATLSLAVIFLQRQGIITESVTSEHLHDVGKFMFAFIVFWAYIAYSQYMLIWYANIPEETGWYLVRQSGDWAWVSIGLLLLHFVLPFLLLISRFPKRRPTLLALGAVYVLVVHWLDLFWVVQPQKSPLGHMPVPLLDIFLVLAVAGLYIHFTVRGLKGVNLIPVRDPRLGECLAHQNY